MLLHGPTLAPARERPDLKAYALPPTSDNFEDRARKKNNDKIGGRHFARITDLLKFMNFVFYYYYGARWTWLYLETLRRLSHIYKVAYKPSKQTYKLSKSTYKLPKSTYKLSK